MLKKIIGPEPLRRLKIEELGHTDAKICQDPNNKACILITPEDPFYSLHHMPDFHTLNAYFGGPFPTKVRTILLNVDKEGIAIQLASLAIQYDPKTSTPKECATLTDTLSLAIAVLTYEDIIPECDILEEVNNKTGAHRWILRHKTEAGSVAAEIANSRLRNFFKDNHITHTERRLFESRLFELGRIDFILHDLIEIACLLTPSLNTSSQETQKHRDTGNLYGGLYAQLIQQPILEEERSIYEQRCVQAWFGNDPKPAPITWQFLLREVDALPDIQAEDSPRISCKNTRQPS